MDELVKQSVELLRKMVGVPSQTFNEDAVVQLIHTHLSEWGLNPVRYGNNIVVVNKFYDESRPTLALDAHIDTVPASESCTRDPYDPGTDARVVYGLGSNDDGGSVVALIAVLRHFYEQRLPINLALTLSCEEERSGVGGVSVLYGPDGPECTRNARWVLFGEPTGMKMATSERGLLVIDGVAEGVSGHAARGEGVNALYIALDDIAALREHKFERHSELMGDVRLSVTQINAGTTHNVIPDKCTFVVDVRPTEQYDNGELTAELQSLCRSCLTPRNLKNRSSATYAASPFLATAKEMGMETFSSPTTSNWVKLNRDAVKMGPGDSRRSHKADEYIEVSEIEDAFAKYIEFITRFYGNALE